MNTARPTAFTILPRANSTLKTRPAWAPTIMNPAATTGRSTATRAANGTWAGARRREQQRDRHGRLLPHSRRCSIGPHGRRMLAPFALWARATLDLFGDPITPNEDGEAASIAGPIAFGEPIDADAHRFDRCRTRCSNTIWTGSRVTRRRETMSRAGVPGTASLRLPAVTIGPEGGGTQPHAAGPESCLTGQRWCPFWPWDRSPLAPRWPCWEPVLGSAIQAGNSTSTRLIDGQPFLQTVFVACPSDVSGFTGLYSCMENRDPFTQQYLGLTDCQRRLAGSTGAFELTAWGFVAAGVGQSLCSRYASLPGASLEANRQIAAGGAWKVPTRFTSTQRPALALWPSTLPRLPAAKPLRPAESVIRDSFGLSGQSPIPRP